MTMKIIKRVTMMKRIPKRKLSPMMFSSLVSIVRLIIIWPIKDEEEG